MTFADRMAASLGLHAADIKVVQIYQGSTIVDFEIIRDVLAEEVIDFDEVIATFEEVMSTTDEFMGSKILQISTTGGSIIPNTEDVHQAV